MRRKAQHARRYRGVPDFVRGLREEAGLTQRDLAERLGQPQPWVHYCETGSRRVDMAEFADWAAACGIAPAEAYRRFCEEARR